MLCVCNFVSVCTFSIYNYCCHGNILTGQSPIIEGSPRDTPTPGRSRIHKRNERGETPLHIACIKGDLTVVSNLLGQGADIDANDNAGIFS